MTEKSDFSCLPPTSTEATYWCPGSGAFHIVNFPATSGVNPLPPPLTAIACHQLLAKALREFDRTHPGVQRQGRGGLDEKMLS